MEEKYLIDTNILIYYLDNKIPESQDEKISNIIENSFNISTISKIEILGWNKLSKEVIMKIENFLSNANVIFIEKEIEKKSISLKQKQKIETPDCIIAATAMLNKMTLVTRNISDFKNIKGLKLYNPFAE
ncbi:MAG: type II toxin-antitoxin system VapC family toxin [Bacteroidota bacterium]